MAVLEGRADAPPCQWHGAFERAAPAMGSGACAASGASNASAAAATRLYGAATGRAAGISRPLPALAFEGCPAGRPGRRSDHSGRRPDGSLSSGRVRTRNSSISLPLAAGIFGRGFLGAIASLLLGVTPGQHSPASPTTARAALPRATRRRAPQPPESSLSQAR